MDGFNIIQNFFAKMKCNSCAAHLEPHGIELIRHDQGVYIVNVQCTHCDRQMGIAMVGLEGAEMSEAEPHIYEDPELTPAELERLADSKPINYDDVLDAHQFFNTLDEGWSRFLPEETRQWDITSELESQAG